MDDSSPFFDSYSSAYFNSLNDCVDTSLSFRFGGNSGKEMYLNGQTTAAGSSLICSRVSSSTAVTTAPAAVNTLSSNFDEIVVRNVWVKFK